jgi:hypothetical protein
VSNILANEFNSVVAQVRAWPQELRQTLAEELLRSVQEEQLADRSRGVPADQVRGIAAGDRPPPDDDTVRQWIDEWSVEKHG